MKSIGTKLALRIAVVIIVIMAMFGVLDIYYQRAQFKKFLDAKEEFSMQLLSENLEESLFYMNLDRIDTIVHSYLSDVQTLSIKILKEGKEEIVTYSGKDPNTKEIINFGTQESQAPHYTETITRQIQLTYDGQPLGKLEIVFSRQLLNAQTQKTIMTLSGSLLVVIVVECLVVLTLVRRDISGPLNPLVQAARQIAEGNVDIHLTNVPSQDEIGTLTKAFKKMVTYLQHMAGVAIEISNGDLHHEVSPRSEKDLLGQAFLNMSTYLNEMAASASAIADGDLTHSPAVRSADDTFGQVMQAMTAGLQTLILHIRASANQLVTIKTRVSHLANDDLTLVQEVNAAVNTMIATMHGLAASIEDVAENMTVLSSSVEETSAAVAQMTPSIGHIVANTQTLTTQIEQTRTFVTETLGALEETVESAEVSKRLSQNTIQDGLKGQEAIEQMTTSMETLDGTIRTAVGAITSFAQRSQDIERMLTVIQEITDQTALLALNAAIIAAQAGEHGRGFAVVAEEMKTLATGVSASTKDIAGIIQTVQQDTARVVETVHAGGQQVTQGLDKTRQAREALHNMVTSAHRSSTVVSEIVESLRAGDGDWAWGDRGDGASDRPDR